jgi:hypothetical protein
VAAERWSGSNQIRRISRGVGFGNDEIPQSESRISAHPVGFVDAHDRQIYQELSFGNGGFAVGSGLSAHLVCFDRKAGDDRQELRVMNEGISLLTFEKTEAAQSTHTQF